MCTSLFWNSVNTYLQNCCLQFPRFFTEEGNWRNDYPDEEEDQSDSSQERRFYADYGFDSGELLIDYFGSLILILWISVVANSIVLVCNILILTGLIFL